MPRAKRNPAPDGRAGNGGARQGTPGTQYSNRSDLRAQKPTAAPGQAYGAAGAQLAAQQAVPMAGGPTPPGPAPFPPGYVAPGEVTPLHAPTERPGEPVTHGLTGGPGAGPEVLGSMVPANNLGALLAQVAASQGASPDVKALAQFVAGGPR